MILKFELGQLHHNIEIIKVDFTNSPDGKGQEIVSNSENDRFLWKM